MFCCRISPFIVFFSSLNYPTVWISICFSKDLPIKEFIRQKHYGCNLNLLPISATISHSLFSTRHTDPLNVFYSLSLSLSLSFIFLSLSLSLYFYLSLYLSLFLSLSLSLSLSQSVGKIGKECLLLHIFIHAISHRDRVSLAYKHPEPVWQDWTTYCT